MPEPRVPPGRAGRLWLQRRLRTADRAVTLLDRKLRILRTEQERFHLLAERTGAQWATAQRDAEVWLLRAAVLSGQREIRLSTTAAAADVTVRWGSVMGVRYPVDVTCQVPEPAERGGGTAAMVEATTAYAVALRAAAAHAVAEAARRTVDAEVARTRQRLHANADRWLPRLRTALHDLTQRLEESERAETVRLHWAARSDGGAR